MENGDKIRLWTFQESGLFDMVMTQGVGYCNKEGYMAQNWPKAYQWMHKEMMKRIGMPEVEGVSSSLWAWRYFNGKKSAKPRRSIDNIGDDNDSLVFMELLIPANRILCSDFTLWHNVLNEWKIETGDNKPMEETWERIFDPTFNHPDWCTEPWEQRCIQANFWCLFKEDIVYADLLQKQEGKRALLRTRLYETKR